MLAQDLTRAMAAGRGRMPADLAELITADRAWPLSVLLAAWGGTKPGIQSGLPFSLSAPLFFQAFDFVADTLLPIVGETYASRSDPESAIRFAGLGLRFAAAAAKLGKPLLTSLIGNDQFTRLANKIRAQYPMPLELRQLFEPTTQTPAAAAQAPAGGRDRIRAFDGFDAAPRRRPEDDPAFLRRQLDQPSLDPSLRMYMEERLAFSGLPIYRSDSEARLVWESVLQSPMPEEVRSYFKQQLRSLDGSGDLEV